MLIKYIKNVEIRPHVKWLHPVSRPSNQLRELLKAAHWSHSDESRELVLSAIYSGHWHPTSFQLSCINMLNRYPDKLTVN